LRNVLERAIIFARGGTLDFDFEISNFDDMTECFLYLHYGV
jgi:hypothetical protein